MSFTFNTIATSATAVCIGEALFRKAGIRLFSDDSNVGRGILHGLDISQYLLAAACFLVPMPTARLIGTVIGIAFVLPTPLICKAICKWTNLNSETYQFASEGVQAFRSGSKILFLCPAGLVFLRAETGIAKVISGCKFVVLTLALVSDTVTSQNYINQSTIKDFYLYLRQ